MEVVVEEYGLKLGKTSERLTVRREDKLVAEVPFRELTAVVINSRGVSISSDLLFACAEHGIAVHFLSFNGKPIAFLSAEQDFGRADVRRAQMHAADNCIGRALAAGWIRRKLESQAEHLADLMDAEGIPAGALEAARKIHDVVTRVALLAGADAGNGNEDVWRERMLGHEAQGAIHYWGALAAVLPREIGFRGRDQDAGDAFNACLNYGYGILYSRVWSLAVKAGLDPYVGFLHKHYRRRPALVYDLIEPYRIPVVNRPLVRWIRRGGRPVWIEQDRFIDRDSRQAVAERVLKELDPKDGGWEKRMAADIADALKAMSPADNTRQDGTSSMPFPGMDT